MTMIGDLATAPSRWPYIASDHPNGLPQPGVPVTFLGPESEAGQRVTVTVDALLDSGAESVMVPEKWAARLGVDLDGAETVTAWGNGVLATYYKPADRLIIEVAARRRRAQWSNRRGWRNMGDQRSDHGFRAASLLPVFAALRDLLWESIRNPWLVDLD